MVVGLSLFKSFNLSSPSLFPFLSILPSPPSLSLRDLAMKYQPRVLSLWRGVVSNVALYTANVVKTGNFTDDDVAVISGQFFEEENWVKFVKAEEKRIKKEGKKKGGGGGVVMGKEEVEEVLREMLKECNRCILENACIPNKEEMEQKLDKYPHFFHECRMLLGKICRLVKKGASSSSSPSSSSSSSSSSSPSGSPSSLPPSPSYPLSTPSQLLSLLARLSIPFSHIRHLFSCMSSVASSHLSYCALHTLPPFQQSRILNWVFKKEDIIWRERGGRDEVSHLSLFIFSPSFLNYNFLLFLCCS